MSEPATHSLAHPPSSVSQPPRPRDIQRITTTKRARDGLVAPEHGIGGDVPEPAEAAISLNVEELARGIPVGLW